MIILVLGSNTAADYLSQQLLKDERVEAVYHFGANATKCPAERYFPESFSERQIKQFIDTHGNEIDLIVPTTLYCQLIPKLLKDARAKNIPVLAPAYNLHKLEWSKLTGKRLLNHLKIPTPSHQVLDRAEFFKTFYSIPRPFVVKYEEDWRSGLQTIVVTDENCDQEFSNLIYASPARFLDKNNNSYDNQVFIVEEFISGQREYSWHALCNQTGWTYLGSARDYKRRYEGDQGYNTAGMGSYSPVEQVDPRIDQYTNQIVEFLKDRGTPYVGVLYLGIMIAQDGTPVVLEINTRFGSPEIESILQTVDSNLLDLLLATAANQQIPTVKYNDRVGVSLRLVNQVYEEKSDNNVTPEQPKLWPLIGGIQMSLCNSTRLLHSVLTTSDVSITAASDKIYRFLKNKPLGDYTYRTDIGYLK